MLREFMALLLLPLGGSVVEQMSLDAVKQTKACGGACLLLDLREL